MEDQETPDETPVQATTPEFDDKAGGHETQRELRLRRILELKDEGLNEYDIGAAVGISGHSVRSILSKYRANTREELDEERRTLTSSLASSLTNHSPDEDQILQIEMVRKAADSLCLVIDKFCPDSRERSLAKTHLEETVMWAVKSIVLPRPTVAQGGASMTAGLVPLGRDIRVSDGMIEETVRYADPRPVSLPGQYC